mgnify:CR=1 FL=1
MRINKVGGFTLIELMIAVAVVGILAAIAYPSYIDSIRKSRRADAKAVLLQAAQWMERFYTENNRYDQNRAGTAVGLPTGLSRAPIEGTNVYYIVTLTATTANSFTLQAAPTSTGSQDADPCETLTLTNTGVKGVTNSPTLTATECWR